MEKEYPKILYVAEAGTRENRFFWGSGDLENLLRAFQISPDISLQVAVYELKRIENKRLVVQ